MTLEEAIQHAQEQANRGCSECANEHQQLAEWLIELKRLNDPIDEDKLDELAKDFAYKEVASNYEELFHKLYPGNRENFGFISCEKAFKAGYRKAIEI